LSLSKSWRSMLPWPTRGGDESMTREFHRWVEGRYCGVWASGRLWREEHNSLATHRPTHKAAPWSPLLVIMNHEPQPAGIGEHLEHLDLLGKLLYPLS
jgi:hypothetical protein